MWKKTAVIVMCLAFLLSMTGCGGSGKESNEQNAAVKEADALRQLPIQVHRRLKKPTRPAQARQLPIQVHRKLKKPMRIGQMRQTAPLLRRVHRLEAHRKKRPRVRPVPRQQHNTED